MSTLIEAPAICYLNRADGATIATTNAAANFPASNLNSPRLSTSWRSSSLATQSIDADLGATYTDLDVFALLGVNFSNAATSDPVFSNASNYTSPTYNPASANAFDLTYTHVLDDSPATGRNMILVPGSTQSARYLRFAVSDAANAAGYMSARVYWAGPMWQPPVGIDHESELAFALLGHPGIERYIREWMLVLHALSQAEATQLQSILLNKLRSGRYLIIPHPHIPETWVREAIYARMVSAPKVLMMPRAPYWTVEVVFREVED